MDFGRVGPQPAPGTLAHIDGMLSAVIAHQKPMAVTDAAVKHDVALFWLRRQRPDGLLARLRWAWNVARDLLEDGYPHRSRPRQ